MRQALTDTSVRVALMGHTPAWPQEKSAMAEHGSKLDQIRALREARMRAAERAALASEINKKPGAKPSAVADPPQDE